MRHDILEVHPSDHSECLARTYAEIVDGVDTSGVAAKVGTAIHAVAEAIAYAVAESPAIDQREIASTTFKRMVRALDIPPVGVVDGLRILDKVLAFDSRIQLHAEPGWSSRPEVRWAIDVDLTPYEWHVDPTSGEGWWRDDDGKPAVQSRILAAGRIDLEEWLPDQTAGRITDFKSARAFRDAEDAYEDFQLRTYAWATFIRRPQMQTIEARFAMLRHGYLARADFIRGEAWSYSTETQLRAIREQRERAVETGVWAETPGPWCAYCPRMMVCKQLAAVVEQGSAVAPDLPHAEQIRRWKALTRLADEYEEIAKAPFQDFMHDAPVHLGDAKGTHFGWKDTNAWMLVNDYEQTMRLVRELVPDKAWPATFAAKFRYCRECDLPGRVAGLLGDLKVTDDVRDRIVLPLTKPMLTTFRPEVVKPVIADDAAADVIDDFLEG